jgi:type II secretory pathway pseudopilin PulG
LVELLVVIGVIALLISLLLPALNVAREAANRTKCASDIRQILIAYRMCANERKGHIPSVPGHYVPYSQRYSPSNPIGSPTFSPYNYWSNPYITYQGTDPYYCIVNYARLWYNRYLATADVFWCPSDNTVSRADSWDPFIAGPAGGISMFNFPYSTRGSYFIRLAPGAMYVGGYQPTEETESNLDKIPNGYWFIECRSHYSLLNKARKITLHGYADAHVDIDQIDRSELGW